MARTRGKAPGSSRMSRVSRIRRRRRPSLRFQLVLVGVAVSAIVVMSFVGDDGERPSAPSTSPTTEPRGFPPAADESVCRTLITTEEAEALVGRPLEHPVIEPIANNCAWPVTEGTPLDAELFLIVELRGAGDLRTQLDDDFAGIPHRIEAVEGLGDEAALVIRDGPEGEFVEGLYVLTRERRIALANGGRPIWSGSDDQITPRLRLAMGQVLQRVGR